jgi:hypothetical protein
MWLVKLSLLKMKCRVAGAGVGELPLAKFIVPAWGVQLTPSNIVLSYQPASREVMTTLCRYQLYPPSQGL